MAKFCNTDALDAMLNWVKNNSNILYLCSAEPATFLEASSTYMLASISIAGGDFTGPAFGDVSGRKITVGAKTDITVLFDGTVTHGALCDEGGEVLVYVDTCASEAVTAGNLVSTNAWDIETRDPT